MILKWVSYLPQVVRNLNLTHLVTTTNEETNKQKEFKSIQAKVELDI